MNGLRPEATRDWDTVRPFSRNSEFRFGKGATLRETKFFVLMKIDFSQPNVICRKFKFSIKKVMSNTSIFFHYYYSLLDCPKYYITITDKVMYYSNTLLVMY